MKQGHYATDENEVAKYPAADFEVDRIGDLLDGARTLLSSRLCLERRIKKSSPRSEARSEDTLVLNAVASTAYEKEGSPRSEAHEDKSVLAPY